MRPSRVTRREFTRFLGLAAGALALPKPLRAAESKPLNVMLFTADDLNCDSLGCYGSPVPDISPNLDKFAAQSMRFDRAHVTVAICQPSRGVLATGLYPHHSGVMGFMHTEKKIPTVMQTFRDAGYLTGVLGKVGHSTPHGSYTWDFVHDQGELGNGRSPTKYHDYCVEFLSRCRKEGKPFYFMVNSHDPHRPYHIPGKGGNSGGAETPSRIYKPSEVKVPGFLPDLPGVRQELSYYFNSVRRLDDTFGKVMAALEETGFADNTLVLFLSDNGIAVLATAVDAAGLPAISGLDGRSTAPLLKGQTQAGRDRVFTQIDCKAGGDAVPMRCIQTPKFGYIFNGWADGEHRYRNNNEGMCMKAMEEAAQTDPRIAERVRVFRFRDVEEFYDLEKDPDCTINLVKRPEFAAEIEKFRSQLLQQMTDSGDPLLAAFQKRHSPKEMSDAMWKAYAPYGTKKKTPGAGKKPKRTGKRKTP